VATGPRSMCDLRIVTAQCLLIHVDGKSPYAANLCPVRWGGAMSHTRLRMTILYSEDGDSKNYFGEPELARGSTVTAFEEAPMARTATPDSAHPLAAPLAPPHLHRVVLHFRLRGLRHIRAS
jgi:hypothetical protein